jgi:transcriptional regulator with XRE-family HTH domain
MITAGPMLKDARKRAGLTQGELAERLGTTQPAIARLERPGANPRLQTLIDAVEATGHTLEAQLAPRTPGIDETLVAASLRESPAERLHHFETLYRTAKDLSGRAFSRNGP